MPLLICRPEVGRERVGCVRQGGRRIHSEGHPEVQGRVPRDQLLVGGADGQLPPCAEGSIQG